MIRTMGIPSLQSPHKAGGFCKTLNREAGERDARQRLKAQWVFSSTVVAASSVFPVGKQLH